MPIVSRTHHFILGKRNNRHCFVTQFAGNVHCVVTTPLFAPSLSWMARPSPLSCKTECVLFALEEETAAQAVVDCIVLAFRGSKSQRAWRWALAATRFIVCAANFSFPSWHGELGSHYSFFIEGFSRFQSIGRLQRLRFIRIPITQWKWAKYPAPPRAGVKQLKMCLLSKSAATVWRCLYRLGSLEGVTSPDMRDGEA